MLDPTHMQVAHAAKGLRQLSAVWRAMHAASCGRRSMSYNLSPMSADDSV